MALPVFVQAGTGVAITAGTSTLSIANTVAGRLIVLQYIEDGSAPFDSSTSNVVNISNLAGTANSITAFGARAVGSPTTAAQLLSFGRSTAGGTCSIDVTKGSHDCFAILYEIKQVSAGTTVAAILENDSSGGAGTALNSVGTSTTIADALVETNPAHFNNLACQFVAVAADQVVPEFTGETGGTWVKRAEFTSASGTAASVGLQTADLLSGNSGIDGGTATITSAAWASLGFYFLEGPSETQPADDSPFGFSGRGAGW